MAVFSLCRDVLKIMFYIQNNLMKMKETKPSQTKIEAIGYNTVAHKKCSKFHQRKAELWRSSR